MTENSERTIRKLRDGSRELKLIVDSTVIDTLKWVWTADVKMEDDPNSSITIGIAEYSPSGMPKGDKVGSHEYSSELTNGVKGITVDEFESVLDRWEQECRNISRSKDEGVMNYRRLIENQRETEERRTQARQKVESYLDSLSNDGD